jgi:hypothetical protein
MGRKGRSKFMENREFFSFLSKIPPKRQKNIIKGADKDILVALSEICLNLIKRNINLTEKEKRRLRPYAKQVYLLSQKKPSFNKKKKVVQVGGFLSTILTSVIPLLLSTVISAASKSKRKQ